MTLLIVREHRNTSAGVSATEATESNFRWLFLANECRRPGSSAWPPFFQYGDRITVRGLWQRPKPFQGFDYPSYLESKGISGVFWTSRVEVEDSARYTGCFG